MACALVATLLAAGVRPARAQGVHVSLLPAPQNVATNSDFTLDLRVIQAGAAFNGFDITVTFDPAALTFLPTSPTSLQQGSLMTGACGNTFHLFQAAADSLAITDVLLCSGVSLTGPGQIYTLRFHALGTPQTTVVHIRSARFYNAGVFVSPVTPVDATIQISVPVGVEPPAAHGGALRLAASPNPARGPVALSIEHAVAGLQRLDVLDIAGRTVRHLEYGEFAAGTRHVTWDGRDDAGQALPAGIYRLVLRAGAEVAVTRVAMLP